MKQLNEILEGLTSQGHPVESVNRSGGGVISLVMEQGSTEEERQAAEAALLTEKLGIGRMSLGEASLRLALDQDNAAARAIVLAEVQRLAAERGA